MTTSLPRAQLVYAQLDGSMVGTLLSLSKYAFANVNASQTDAALVTAIAGKKIRCVALFFVTGGTATNVTFNSKPAGAGTPITCLVADASNGGVVLPGNQFGWFESAVGEGIAVTTGAGSTTGINIVYFEV
jgi:hypothetical protein